MARALLFKKFRLEVCMGLVRSAEFVLSILNSHNLHKAGKCHPGAPAGGPAGATMRWPK